MNERWISPDQPGDPARPPESPATGPGPGPAGGAGDTRMLPQQPPGPAQWATGAGSPVQGYAAPEAGYPGAPWPPAGAVPGAGAWAGAAPADQAGSDKTGLRRVLIGISFVLVLVLATGGAYLFGQGRLLGQGASATSGHTLPNYGSLGEEVGMTLEDYEAMAMAEPSWTTEITAFKMRDDDGVEIRCAFGGDFGFGACAAMEKYWYTGDPDGAHSTHFASGKTIADSDLIVTEQDIWDAATEELEPYVRAPLPDGGWVHFNGFFVVHAGIKADGKLLGISIGSDIWDVGTVG